ncbi:MULTISPECIES: translation elongation factor Ts [Micromonospora]|uniref:Elongation factor Ts n=1 Tax=Micromonospora aurantiaca (nom. illeg.) TaxID=47850 RepID=A0ABQ6U998_9ACTN|nr:MULTISPECIES: translation elongation factor Ts [Micromonospora]KAB1105901.1 elongation factor Ts [Micromonospora aurantiaca]MBF5029617.1 elongation factor Ts [Micromonospora sp. ANENR4]MCO1615130.1 translation elongation factor Ts [Micromonospora sp. CPM1]MCZ7473766.1 translation elongation factor Ts [Micromonospora sp. WMMC273]MDO3682506.1 translation elongation factor Ts [Micromonospora sp. C28ISP2-4]
MSNFTAADVKKLRDLTGAGMMDSKKALTEAEGDFDKAVEILRVKGAKDVGKRAGRTAANGLIAHSGQALLELNCETDFVAKNDAFIALAQQLVEHGVASGATNAEELLASSIDGKSVADLIQEQSAKIGEKLVLNRFAKLDGTTAVYMHRKSQDLPPAVGVLVEFTGKSDEAADADARAVAMQIAAMRPKYLTRDEVPAETVESERRIAEQTAREENKPEAALPKIVEGRVNAFFKDFVLLEQASVADNKKTVKQVLADAGIEVTRFLRFEVGQA